jgi:hypothetical protein
VFQQESQAQKILGKSTCSPNLTKPSTPNQIPYAFLICGFLPYLDGIAILSNLQVSDIMMHQQGELDLE